MAAENGNGLSDTIVDPMAYQRIVGLTFASAEHRPLVTIGKRTWNKWQLGRIGCPHPSAAVRVNRVLQQLRIKTVSEFLQRAHDFGRYKDLGVTSYWTVLALARDCGADIDQVHNDDRSFGAVHRSALKVEAGGVNKRRRKSRTDRS